MSWQDTFMPVIFFEGFFLEQHEGFQITLSLCVQFGEPAAKIFFLCNFLNYGT